MTSKLSARSLNGVRTSRTCAKGALGLVAALLFPGERALGAEVAAVVVIETEPEADSLHRAVAEQLARDGRTVLDRATIEASARAFLPGRSLAEPSERDIKILRAETGVDQVVIVRRLPSDPRVRLRVFQVRAYFADGVPPRVRVTSALDNPELPRVLARFVAETMPARRPTQTATPVAAVVSGGAPSAKPPAATAVSAASATAAAHPRAAPVPQAPVAAATAAPAPSAGAAAHPRAAPMPQAPVAPATTRTSASSVTPDIAQASVTASSKTVQTERDADGSVRSMTTSQSGVTAGKDGIALGASTQTVTRKEPATSASMFAVNLGGGGVILDNITIMMGSFGFSGRGLYGDFPGVEGGVLTALDVAFQLQANIGGGEITVPGTPDVSFDRRTGRVTTTPGVPRKQFLGFYGGQATVELALDLTYFGEMNMKTLEQNGFGVRLGGFAGGRLQGQLDGNGSSDPTAVYGPLFGLDFPTYNTGTTKVSATSLNVIGFPLPNGLAVFVSLGASF